MGLHFLVPEEVFVLRHTIIQAEPGDDDGHRLYRFCCLHVTKICYRAHVMDGMVPAQILIKGDPTGNEGQLGKVLADKERETSGGYDNTWATHLGLVPVAGGIGF